MYLTKKANTKEGVTILTHPVYPFSA